jgi:hypothetical protein
MGKNERRNSESKEDSERERKNGKLKRKQYEAKLDELHMELVKMQYWIKGCPVRRWITPMLARLTALPVVTLACGLLTAAEPFYHHLLSGIE